jgi:PAS domain S-box-containing protein
MEITHKRTARLQAVGAQFLLGIAGLALITPVCFHIGFGVTRTSFVYVILIALVSLLGSLGVSVVLSIIAVACLNYFFVPPLFGFHLDDPDDVVRLAAFFTTSVLVTALTTKLRASEARYRTFVDHATDGFFLLDDHLTVVDVNRQACDSLGYSREELIGKHRGDFDVGLDDASIQHLKQRIVAGQPFTIESRHRRKDGTSFPVEVRVSQFERDGRLFLCLVRDITERKQAEDELRASEARFRSFVDHATDGFFLFDEHQALLDVNRQACESLGYSREEMIGMHPRDFDAALDQASLERIGKRVKAGETVTFETLHRRKDGTVFPVEVRARQFPLGARPFRLSLARDITERKRADEVLRESEAKLQRAQRVAHFGWWERDFTNNRVSLSDEVCRIFGLDPVDLPEWHARWMKLIHPEDRPKAAEAAAAALLPGGPRYDIEYRVVRPDGTERTVHSQGDVTWDESGRPLRQFGVLQDITELRRAEKELRASEASFRTFVDHATDAFFLLDDQATILDVNRRACESLGYRREELIGMRRNDFDVGLDEAAIQRLRQRLRAGETLTFETRHRRKDGTVFPVEIRSGQFEQGGRRLLALGRDITERKRAEEEHERLRQLELDLAHVNRISMMGELAASLAHEILHPIATARNNARAGMRFLEMSPPNLDEVRDALACIVRDADRANNIVGRMRDHIKKAPPRREPFDLNEAIQEVIATVGSAIDKNGVSVRTRLMDRLNPVRGDRVQLQQVVLNLILNAVEAMSSIKEGARELSISSRQSQTSDLLVAVQDSGPGIDLEHIEQVFAPFYTTKTNGIGMGLSICRSIIAAHGGRLWAEANQPRGATFQFTLPPGVEES